jgi:hypothetical protein
MCRYLSMIKCVSIVLFMLISVPSWDGAEKATLPEFGRDTVLVWRMQFPEDTAEFVVRIAEFAPNRFFEWENATTQGTTYILSDAIENGRSFSNARLFEAGVDTKDKETTTLWLSQPIYRDLKSKGKAKLILDSVSGAFTLEGTDHLSIEVNRAPIDLPVIKVKDGRNSELWFLDFEANPLLVKHMVRHFTQTLVSITTDKPNTLRWIKGKKLTAPH